MATSVPQGDSREDAGWPPYSHELREGSGASRYRRDPQEGFAGWALQVFALVALWWTAAVVVVLRLKQTLETFPYSLLITCLVNTTCSLWALVLSNFVQRLCWRPPVPPLTWDESRTLLAIGCMNGVEIGCNNKALEYLSVTTNTMVGSTKVLLQLATALAWGFERLNCAKVLAVSWLTVGGVLQAISRTGESQRATRALGVVLQLTALSIGSQRWAILQAITQRSRHNSALGQMSKLQLVARIFPITGLVCLILGAIFEAPSLALGDVFQPALLSKVLEIGCGVMTLVTSEFMLIYLTSAMALQVLMSLHQIPIFLGGILVLHEQANMLSVCAFVFCVLGAIVYAAARSVDDGADAPQIETVEIELDEEHSPHVGETHLENEGPTGNTPKMDVSYAPVPTQGGK